MELEESIKNIKEQIHNENGEHWNYIDIDNFYDDECENFICSIETILNHLTKQEKMIELMALAISSYDGQLVINQYKDRNEVKAKFEEYAVDGTYEQYFEKKAEESE